MLNELWKIIKEASVVTHLIMTKWSDENKLFKNQLGLLISVGLFMGRIAAIKYDHKMTIGLFMGSIEILLQMSKK